MDRVRQAQKAAELKRLHRGEKILVLPNAWDVISARIVEDLGYPAIATTSAGVAAALGYPDGQRVSRREMLEVIARIAHAVEVPVTADMEAGYGTTPAEMADVARELILSGAVGLNLEDVTGDDESTQVALNLQVEKIRAIQEASASAGVPLVINARTDVLSDAHRSRRNSLRTNRGETASLCQGRSGLCFCAGLKRRRDN
jgi:2-methylisocitrate lyase-like PEP mutase family enzyme